jgi:succinate-semialdehyde dehydrogenase/glutarate-semialdehyde dehydrogenase
LARRILAGTVMVNDAMACFGISEVPHGGVKASGVGRTHGRFGLEEMVRIKYVDSDRLPRMKQLWWYGYGEGFSRQMEGFVDLMFARGWLQKLRGASRSMGAFWRKGRL